MKKLKEYYEGLSPKVQQMVVLMLIIFLFFGGMFLISKLVGKKETQRKTKDKKVSILTQKVEKDIWIAAEGQRVRSMEKEMEDIQGKLDNLLSSLEKVDKKTSQEIQRIKKQIKDIAKKKPEKLPPLPFPEEVKKKTEEKKQKKIPEKKTKLNIPAQPGKQISFIKEYVATLQKKEDKQKKQQRPAVEHKTRKTEETYWIPAGSFMKVVLLNGIDASTAEQASGEPYPVLMSITDLAVLPNRFRMDLRECFVIAAGYGNLSDERVYIRTETLSCIRKDGQTIETSLKGHIVGEDGKLGMRGRLVSKQGQQISKALLAGIASSIAEAFKPSKSISVSLGEGEGQSASLLDIAKGTALRGAGTALDKIADFYIKRAKDIFPVIEVDAGRHAEIFVLKGQEIKFKGGS